MMLSRQSTLELTFAPDSFGIALVFGLLCMACVLHQLCMEKGKLTGRNVLLAGATFLISSLLALGHEYKERRQEVKGAEKQWHMMFGRIDKRPPQLGKSVVVVGVVAEVTPRSNSRLVEICLKDQSGADLPGRFVCLADDTLIKSGSVLRLTVSFRPRNHAGPMKWRVDALERI